MNQTTIQRVVTCSGIGLHSGNKVYLALRPASANTGIIFDIHTPDGIRRVSPAPKAVATTVLATTLGSNGATVSTVEHLLASVLGLGIDNLIISVEGGEIPIMDGSAAAFLELFAEAGIRELPAPRKVMRISRPLELRDGEKYIRALPYAGFRVDCTIDFPRAIDFEKLAEIAHGYGAYLMVDMAHIAGLVAGGQHQSPVPYADVVTTTTHKTLRGPRGGLILTNNPIIAKRINSAVFPGTQGGPLEHVIAAKAVCFGEALKPEFKEYARKIVENAQALAAALQQRGVKLVSGGTDNHLMLIDLRDEECTGKDLEQRLDSVHITANKNTVPGETRSPFVTSGVRLGTPAVTTRGMGAAEMQVIADCIADCIWHYAEKKDEISERVLRLTREFPLYQ